MKTFTKLRTLLLTMLIVGVMAVPSFAVDYYLIAKEVVKTMPDGTPITMWGYAEDTGGACYNTTSGGPNSPATRAARMGAAACTGPVATVPGPRFNVPASGVLRVFLVNLLAEPTSIIVPGQEMPYSAPNNGPTWTSGAPGPRVSADQRVRSFGREAKELGGSQGYVWTPNRYNAFQSGTYLYHSGTHPQLQVQMGLYGASSRDAAAGEPYNGYPVDAQVDMLFSEIDPVLHATVAAGDYKACIRGLQTCSSATNVGGKTTSTLNHHPKYHLVNGEPYNPASPSMLLSAATGDTILVRMMNATYRELVPMLLGGYGSLIAENGRAYAVKTVTAGNITGQANHAKLQYAYDLAAGATKDVILNPQQAGTYWIFDRRLNLTNSGASGGGFRAGIQVAAAP